ncbi:TPA: hypothetical protein ACTYZB_004812 [Klebsiella variicola]
MTNDNIIYGIPEEKERDLSVTMAFFQNLRSKQPVRVVVADGQVFNLFINNFHVSGNRVYLGPTRSYEPDNRVIIPVDYIISVEQILLEEVDSTYKGKVTIKRGDLEEAGFKRSGRDFFQVIRYAYQQRKGIRVYLTDNRVIDGVSTGMNEQSVGIRLPEGKLIQVFYDWVNSITQIDIL